MCRPNGDISLETIWANALSEGLSLSVKKQVGVYSACSFALVTLLPQGFRIEMAMMKATDMV